MGRRINLAIVIGISTLVASLITKIDRDIKYNAQQKEEARTTWRANPSIAPRHSSENPLEFYDNNTFGINAFYRGEGESQEKPLLEIYKDFNGDHSIFTLPASDYLRLQRTNFQFSAYAIDCDGNKSPEKTFVSTNGVIKPIKRHL